MILKSPERDMFVSLKSEKVYKNIFTIFLMVQQPAPAAQPVQPAQPQQPVTVAQPAQAGQPQQLEKKKSKWWVWAAAILGAVIVGVAIGYFL